MRVFVVELYLVEVVCVIVKCVIGVVVRLVVFCDDGAVGCSKCVG